MHDVPEAIHDFLRTEWDIPMSMPSADRIGMTSQSPGQIRAAEGALQLEEFL